LNAYIGTTNYVCPEILQNKSYAGEMADNWSLGVILYTLLHRKLPFNIHRTRYGLEGY